MFCITFKSLTKEQQSLLVAMANHHGATIIELFVTLVDAWFEDEDHADNYHAEATSYFEQQKWLDTLSEEETEALGMRVA